MFAQTQQTLNPTFILFGSLIIVLLVGFIFAFVILYQRKMLLHQQQMQLAETEKQQTALQALLEGQETERQRLAKDLHDGIGTLLSAVGNNLSQIEQSILHSQAEVPAYFELLGKTKQMTHETITDVRQIMNNLMPNALVDFGLAQALSSLCRKIQSAWSIEVSFHCPDKNFSLKEEYALSLYRITQELFNNTVKYAQASHITLSLTRQAEELVFYFADDGVGFNPETLTKKLGSGYGLQNMESRARLLPATYEIKTAPGEGTSVKIVLQLSA